MFRVDINANQGKQQDKSLNSILKPAYPKSSKVSPPLNDEISDSDTTIKAIPEEAFDFDTELKLLQDMEFLPDTETQAQLSPAEIEEAFDFDTQLKLLQDMEFVPDTETEAQSPPFSGLTENKKLADVQMKAESEEQRIQGETIVSKMIKRIREEERKRQKQEDDNQQGDD